MSKFNFNIDIDNTTNNSLNKSKNNVNTQLDSYKKSQMDLRIIDAFKNRNLDDLSKKLKKYLYQNFEKFRQYQYIVKSNEELQDIIEEIDHVDIIDLNWLNTSRVTDMSCLFVLSTIKEINISEWDVSNVRNMASMFSNCNFNCDLSKWDVSNVFRMDSMFENSKFNSDISMWDVSNVEYYGDMFKRCNIKEKFKPKFNK